MRLSYLVGTLALLVLGKLLLEKRSRRECELCGLDLGFLAEGSPCSRCGKRVCDRCLKFDSHCDKCYEDVDARIATSTSDQIPGYKVLQQKGVVTTNRFATTERALFELKVQADEKGANALLRVQFNYADDEKKDDEEEGGAAPARTAAPNLIAQADAVIVEKTPV